MTLLAWITSRWARPEEPDTGYPDSDGWTDRIPLDSVRRPANRARVAGRRTLTYGRQTMNLSPHFSLAEFTQSDTAARLGIDNDLPLALVEVARATAQMMERIRSHLSYLHGHPVPILVTSAYRSPKLNAAIGSSTTSDHIKMRAIDFKAPVFGSPVKVCRALVPVIDELGIGQLIHEFGAWVHVSSRNPDKVINRIVTASTRGYVPGIQEV